MRMSSRRGTLCLVLLCLALLINVVAAADSTTTTSTSKTSTTDASTTTDDATTTTDDSTTTTDSAASTASTDSDVSTKTTATSTKGGIAYPAASVPPTENAPFMQKSNLPTGTVFIAVGAVLGFFGLAVLAWRGLVAWSINRSARRAAAIQSHRESKTLLRGRRKSHFYEQDPSSTMSMEKLATEGRPAPLQSKAPPPAGNLFFSPTAGNRASSGGHRVSSYLPAGYYSASNASAGASMGLGGPKSKGYSRAGSAEPSPPASPEQNRRRRRSSHGSQSRDRRPQSSSNTRRLSSSGRRPSAHRNSTALTNEELMSNLNAAPKKTTTTRYSVSGTSGEAERIEEPVERERESRRLRRHSRRESGDRR